MSLSFLAISVSTGTLAGFFGGEIFLNANFGQNRRKIVDNLILGAFLIGLGRE